MNDLILGFNNYRQLKDKLKSKISQSYSSYNNFKDTYQIIDNDSRTIITVIGDNSLFTYIDTKLREERENKLKEIKRN